LHYCAQIAYDGTDFSGWQRQINAHTIQAEIEDNLSKLLQESITILGCGRTDTGVHAKDYYFNFSAENTLPNNFLFKINHLLPTSIVVKSVYKVAKGFSARFDANGRTYEYHIHMEKDPFQNAYSLFVEKGLDIAKMNEACQYLLGRQDFQSFSKAKTEVNNFFCDITRADWSVETNGQIIFTITANRFLRNMVRAIVGSLLEVGIGKQKPEYIVSVIAAKNRQAAGKSVAAKALFLTTIKYDKSEWQILS
jgi:tRNA pseudouridine38-40 synthase